MKDSNFDSSCNALHTNQKILIDALVKKGASVFVEDLEQEIVKVVYKKKTSYLLDRFNERVPYNWVCLTASKIFVKNLLSEHKVSVPLGDVFNGEDKRIISAYACELGYPVVVKPDWGSHGDDVYVDIRTQKELSKVVSGFIKRCGKETKFIIEEYFPGTEHRIFITQNGDVAVLRREPAHIIGDGENSIHTIIKAENKQRINLKKNSPTALCPITIDEHVEKHLAAQGLSLNSIPGKNQKIYLRLTSNMSKGGKSCNVTALVHPSVIEIARRIAAAIPLPFMGIDFITQDITAPQTPGSYRILEVNSSPGFAMHLFPNEGEAVNVGEYALKVLFPDL